MPILDFSGKEEALRQAGIDQADFTPPAESNWQLEGDFCPSNDSRGIGVGEWNEMPLKEVNKYPQFTWNKRKVSDNTDKLPTAVDGSYSHLFQGDNLYLLQWLQKNFAGKIQLVYLDPPFNSGVKYGYKKTAGENEGRAGFDDSLSLDDYLASLFPRLVLLAKLLCPDGALYLHCDAHAASYLKILLDEIFGIECFQRQIIWRMGWVSGYKTQANNWIRNHDVILYYGKCPRPKFHRQIIPYPTDYRRRDGKKPKGSGIPLEDVWNGSAADILDSIQIKSFSREKTGFPTQKNLDLLYRIIAASSSPGDWVLDPFAGSGTTGLAANMLGRHALLGEQEDLAVRHFQKRLLLYWPNISYLQTAEETKNLLIQDPRWRFWYYQEGHKKIKPS